jgi:hypothetical protein
MLQPQTQIEELKRSLDNVTVKHTSTSAECSKLLRKQNSRIREERSKLIEEAVAHSKQVEHLEALLKEKQKKRNTYQWRQETLLAELNKEAGEVKQQSMQLQEVHDSKEASLENEQSLLNLENEFLEDKIKTMRSHDEDLKQKLHLLQIKNLMKYHELEKQQKQSVELNFEKAKLSNEKRCSISS